ncbi:glycoside hydrolase family 65 protein [Ktedonospora formicarum]|uniref:Glycosyl hydrolase n=1 Tax=Ktedonospora formicarum TaxID=2778364 RepID=A0A8J3I1Q5_9CHLR|nr:glycosyl hydrolase family 65 protein [Ktedonospora formicarum]GHO45991.1 glycosyl hydrolase [Ktedonospora formicarum]
MIQHPNFSTKEWSIFEEIFQPDILAQTESIFALSNGHIGLRGNLDEGEPHGLPGSYLNSVYEQYPIPYGESAYGNPEAGQTIINVTNGKLIRLTVEDEPFDIRYGTIHSHTRELDLRNGILNRRVHWTSPAGQTIKVTSTRLVSFSQRAIAAICYEVEPIDMPMRFVLQSELVANEELLPQSKDPRSSRGIATKLLSEEHQAQETRGLLIHRTSTSGLRIGAGMDHTIEGPSSMKIDADSSPDIARMTVTAQVKPGEKIRLVKFIAYGWSSLRSRPAIHDQVIAALSAALMTGWNGLLSEQRSYLDTFWSQADVELEGDPQIQQAVRFALFHVLQASARAERRPIPAKGLTGPGYDGHTFWDTEIFVLPVLTLTNPSAVADALYWRYSILEQAKERAQQIGLQGAAFPWRTIAGEECSGYWPASVAAFHINADIAYAVVHYIGATGDLEFEEKIGLPLLIETARLWYSLGYEDNAGHFRIDGVTGPDEYSALVDNNSYTNLMAQLNLRSAAEVASRHAQAAKQLQVHDEEIANWLRAAERMFLPYDAERKITPQDETFLEHEIWDFEQTREDQYPLFLHFHYAHLYRKQVVKQADLVLAMQLFSDAFSAEQKARNFEYYEALTVRDSSLSASTQAVLAAEVGQLQLAYDYLGEAAFMDLYNLEHNTQDGLHMASLAGSWTALVEGLGGLRWQDGSLSFMPRLPEKITSLAFRLLFKKCRIRVEIRDTEATYSLLEGESIKVLHHGEEIVLSSDAPITRSIPSINARPKPIQPARREPLRRNPGKMPMQQKSGPLYDKQSVESIDKEGIVPTID